MVKCPRCGYDNVSSATYCENCTYLLSGAPTGQKKDAGWNIGTGRKIILVVGIVVIAFLLFSFIYNISQPDSSESLNIIEADKNVQQEANKPYQVNIIYNGSWYGKVGDPNYLQEKSGYGNKVIGLDCAAWDRVSVNVQKDDYSSKNLTVQLLKNGEVVVENTTSKPMGSIAFSYKS